MIRLIEISVVDSLRVALLSSSVCKQSASSTQEATVLEATLILKTSWVTCVWLHALWGNVNVLAHTCVGKLR